MINIFGSNHGELGDLKENLIIKTAGKIKIQIGKKFIDLIDSNGNINVKTQKLILSISSADNIKEDGFYYIDDNLVASIGGNQIILSSETGTTYVSFVTNLNTSTEEKHQALKNIGFIYDDIKDIPENLNAIVYVESEKSLYIVNGSDISKYLVDIPNPYPKLFVIENISEDRGALYIKGLGVNNSIKFDSLEIYELYSEGIIDYNNSINFRNSGLDIVKINNSLETNSIQSFYATNSSGFRLYEDKGKSILEVDNIIVRDGIPSEKSLLPTEYFEKENIITSINEVESDEDEEDEDEESTGIYECILKYTSSYEEGEILLIYILNIQESEESEEESDDDESEEEEIDTNSLIPVLMEVLSSNGNTITVSCERDLDGLSNIICCKVSNVLAIGNIGKQYNSSEFGIISDLNLFYSAKFDKKRDNDFPFYSDSLYDSLPENIPDKVIPPMGKILKSPLKEINGIGVPEGENICITFDDNSWKYIKQTSYLDFLSIPFSNVLYVSNDKKIYFYNLKNQVIGYIDTVDFIKDGMVSGVDIVSGKLVITFNTDAGKEDIEIDLSRIFNSDNYYTKSDIDGFHFLTSHLTLKTINNLSLIGEGNITINTQSDWNLSDLMADDFIKNKPNFATINGQPIINGGNITISLNIPLTDINSLEEPTNLDLVAIVFKDNTWQYIKIPTYEEFQALKNKIENNSLEESDSNVTVSPIMFIALSSDLDWKTGTVTGGTGWYLTPYSENSFTEFEISNNTDPGSFKIKATSVNNSASVRTDLYNLVYNGKNTLIQFNLSPSIFRDLS